MASTPARVQPLCTEALAADSETTAPSSAGVPTKAQTHADNGKMLRRMIKKQLCTATSLEYYKSLQLVE